jgi:hypothetical protein
MVPAGAQPASAAGIRWRANRRKSGTTGGEIMSEDQTIASEAVEEIALVQTIRQKVVAWALWGVTNKSRVHYGSVRPIDGLNHPGQLPLTTDCSGWVTLCYKWAGARDPNCNGYSGQGSTGTILACAAGVIRETAILPGDLIVFGPGTGSHVVVAVTAGANCDVVSHGSATSPSKYPLRDAKTYFPAPVRALRMAGLGSSISGGEEPDDEVWTAIEPCVEVDPNASNPPVGPEGK